MTTTRDHGATNAARLPDRTDMFLECLAAQDFARLGGTLAADARLRALLPRGQREWTGAEEIAGTFAGWFGDTEDFELVEATVGEVGDRFSLRWRLRLRAERLGPGWFTIEQQIYADADGEGRIVQLDLLCTGYRREIEND
jgi:SnoaL-like domain